MTPVGDLLMSLMEDVGDDSGLPELLCRDASRRLGVAGAGIALMDSAGVMERVVGSDERAVELETLQLTLGEGPCTEAFHSGRLVLVADLTSEDARRWPVYTPQALELGVASMFSYPLHIGAIRLGVFDLFHDAPGMLSDESFALALDYADVAILVLLHLQSLETEIHDLMPAVDPDGDGHNGTGHNGTVHHTLDLAFRSHPEVHQATGMVSVQAGVGLREALLMLRGRAFATDRTLHEVARDVVDRRLRFP